jgi:alanine racemase
MEAKDGSTWLHIPNYGAFEIPFIHKHKLSNLRCVLETLKTLEYPPEWVTKKLKSLPQLAMRMEVIQGKNNNLFINDSYMMDGLSEAVAYMDELASGRKKYVFLKSAISAAQKDELQSQISSLDSAINTIWFDESEEINATLEKSAAFETIAKLENAIVLFKGYHGSGISNLLAPFVLRSHPTVIEIKRKSLRNNLTQFKNLLNPETKLMIMVKAAAYGAGAFEMSSFLEREGVDYLGVAFPDEGVALRKQGVSLPIMVMNTHEHSFYDIIRYDLEPAIFSIQQLDSFTAEIIRQNKRKHAIHIKLETGMNRLGFREEDLGELIEYLSSQPEIQVKSVYSHLAESGNSDREFTQKQLHRFNQSFERLAPAMPSDVMRHICNTDGIINYPEAHFDMVRLGIGLFGYAKLTGLEDALNIKTRISKINHIEAGESLGYDRSFVAKKPMKIAVLPIGYADGFRRIYGNGVGRVNIGGYSCPILGNICMDMCFADISAIPSDDLTEVELIGREIKVSDWAAWAQTIPYEVITSLSSRLNRIWVE